MLTEMESKRRLGLILNQEECPEVDWVTVAAMSVDLLQQLHSSAPVIVEAFLTQYAIRRADPLFARTQRLQLVTYLRS